MSDKIKLSALEKMQGKRSDKLVSLRLRITTPLVEEAELMTAWGGTLYFDSGIMAIVSVPVSRVSEIAAWEIVLEII